MRPFHGMPSIDYKYSIALELGTLAETYGLPVVVLYFGDYDEGGLIIPETSLKDIRGWCAADFEYIRCGLNEGDNVRYEIPENFDKPDTYQWEALTDAAAADLITSNVGRYVDDDVIEAVGTEATAAEDRLRDFLQNFSAMAEK